MIAAVRVRGTVDTDEKIEKTLQTLNLTQRNQCVVVENTDSIRGMLNRAKDYIAFGEVDEGLELLEEVKGEDIKPNTTINLSPPSGGFRDIKRQVGQGGSLGERENMDDLLKKMV